MTVLQVCAYAAPYEGNFIKSLKALGIALSKGGHEQIYAFPESARELAWVIELRKHSKVYFLPLSNARLKPKTYFLLKRIFRENPTIRIVHSHFELYDVPVELTAPKGTKVYWHLHDAIEIYDDLKNRLANYVQYHFFGKHAILLSVAEKYMEFVIRLGFSREKALLLPNGLDTSRIVKKDILPEKSHYDFLTFGWDFDVKGISTIIDACELINNNGGTLKFLLNGTEDTWKKLDNYTSGKQLPYLHRCAPVENVNEMYGQADTFILASKMETFSYSVCEAAYSGMQVICSDIPELGWAKELPTVLFFEVSNPEDLQEKMNQVLNGAKPSAEKVNAARSVIEEKYSVEHWVKRVLSIYMA